MPLIEKPIMTRDSWFWKILMGIGSVTFAITMLPNPTDYAIPSTWMPYIRGISFVLGVIGGLNSTSTLPHSEEGGAKITRSGR